MIIQLRKCPCLGTLSLTWQSSRLTIMLTCLFIFSPHLDDVINQPQTVWEPAAGTYRCLSSPDDLLLYLVLGRSMCQAETWAFEYSVALFNYPYNIKCSRKYLTLSIVQVGKLNLLEFKLLFQGHTVISKSRNLGNYQCIDWLSIFLVPFLVK